MIVPQVPPIKAWMDAAGKTWNVPWTAWSAASKLAVLASGGDLEAIDPETGKRTVLVARKAFEAARRRAVLAPPLDHSPGFERLAVMLGRELDVYDTARRKFSRIDAGEVRSAAFSPDGRKLAYAKEGDLYVWSAATGRSTRLTTAERPGILNGVLSWVYWEELLSRQEIAYHWSPDSRRIAYLQADETPVKSSSFVDFDQAPPTVHTQAYPFAGTPNPQVRVGVVSANGGRTVWLRPGPYEYVSRFGWAPNGMPWLLTLNRRITRSELWTANAATGAARRVLFDANPQWVNLTDDVRFLRDGTVLMNSQRDGYDRLYHWSARGGILNAVTPPGHSLAKPLFATGGLRWVDPKGETILFASGDPQRFETQLMRSRVDGGSTAEVTDEPGSHEAKVSPDGRFFVDVHSRLDDAPRATLRALGGRTVAVLGERPALAFKGLEYRRAEMLRLPARDGFPLPAYVRLPVGFDPKKRYPAIVSVYGGPGLPSVVDAWRGVGDQIFTSSGYVLFCVDPRSATLLDERLARAMKGRASGEKQVEDLVDGVRWLKSRPYVDPARVGIFGWSGGGTFVLSAMTRTKEFAAGMAGAPVTDWRFYDTVYAETLMGLPGDNPQGYAETAQWRNAGSLHGRLLIQYGTHDDNVHPINEERFLDALVKAGKTAEVMVYPNRKHGFEDAPAQMGMIRTMLDFFKRSL